MRKYDLTGVGLNLGTGEEFIRKLQTELPRKRKPEDSGVWVLGLIKGSTADAAGIGQGDEVLAVDGESADGKTPFQVSSALQGGPNSDRTVDITVAKAENGQVSRVKLERPAAQAITSPVNSQLRREGGRKVGYIRLTSFNALAQVDVAEAVRSMGAAGADELVLDLRDNRGGLVTSGIEVARLFLDSGSTVVVTKGAARNDRVLAPGPPLTTTPLTVLVNEHTASASEILAGALRDNCRATLVGARTYGKGLIQSVYELSDASGIVITVGKYLTPAGTNIDRDGIRADFARTPPTSERDATLQACRVDRP
jgi:C-terminal peptidase prc